MPERIDMVHYVAENAGQSMAVYRSIENWGGGGSRKAVKAGNPLYHIHRKAIYHEALRVGAEAGLASEDRVIWARLKGYHHYLSRIWDFQHWIFAVPDAGGQVWVMPPILEQAHQAMHLHNPNLLTISNKLYRIHAPARLITSVPRWQSYLMPDLAPYPKERDIPPLLLPHTAAQRAVWKKGIARGWKAGVALARNNFTMAVYTMRRDFLGILLYDRLHAENRIGSPYFAISDMGTVNHGADLRENDRILRITKAASWHVNGLRPVHHYVLHWNPGLPSQTIVPNGKL
ncbi:type IV secretion system DotC family protein [Acidithiobacillus sp. VAN18-4]|nr:type IV secretion system DotC family protein [Acidithiobacillus sp. BN09-2]MBU2799631.1 type IV secretion system DotC family protein [Acidithiobacillus sp. VAN18-4]